MRFLIATTLAALTVWFIVRADAFNLTQTLLAALVPIGLLAAPGLAVTMLAFDREGGTWRFVSALPIGRPEMLRIKWGIGAIQLLMVFAVSGAVASLAAASRGMLDTVAIPEYVRYAIGRLYPEGDLLLWLWSVVLSTAVSFLGWYTVLFYVLTRARHFTEAVIGAVLLSAAMFVWLVHGLGMFAGAEELRTIVSVSAFAHPLSPLLTLAEPVYERAGAIGISVVVWTALPVWFSSFFVNRIAEP